MTGDEGWTPCPDAVVEDGKVSKVLDHTGQPYVIKQSQPIGFKLKKKESNG